MPFELADVCLLRAPLLPDDAGTAALLDAHPLGREAIALASPSLAEAPSGDGRAAALDRYARRAAFRATPTGLLAGVAVAALGESTTIETGDVRAQVTPTWGRLAALGRALLEDPLVRPRVKLRVAPSLVVRGDDVRFVAFERDADDAVVERALTLDPDLRAVLAATLRWTPWSTVRKVVGADPESADELLLVLVDRGLLHHDLTPPLVGPPPAAWMAKRLARLGRKSAARLDDVLAARDVRAARGALAALPGHGAPGPDLGAVLVHEPRRATVARDVVARAAEVAPFLSRLQEALAPPVAERALAGASSAVAATAELHGAGALDLGSLLCGHYGVDATTPDPVGGAPSAAVLAWLADAIAEAARRGSNVISLDEDALLPLVPAVEPTSIELFLAPTRAPDGTGWLLGLHGPAGATWGRFAHALGPGFVAALRALDDDPAAVDVAWAAAPSLGDLGAHPPVRRRALAVSSWPEGSTPVLLDRLEIVPNRLTGAPAALRERDGRPVSPRPLHRVRSTTAPSPLVRLVLGFEFRRQHAPWAFAWGPLSGLTRLPRVMLRGFVVAPASFRIPDADTLRAPDAIAAWRRALEVPRHVQIGHEDELLRVDLEAPDAARDLARHAGGRAFEIWPPAGELADRGGRRVEIVACARFAPETTPPKESRLPVVPPPRLRPPEPALVTWKLFGPEDRQDELLTTVDEALRAARGGRWFFSRYVEGPGRRPHLRVRTRESSRIADVLRAYLRHHEGGGALAGIERGPFWRELGRYGGLAACLDVERLFALDSADALVELGSDEPLAAQAARFDALCRGLGLSLAARAALAEELADAAVHDDVLAARLSHEHRRIGRALGASLDDPHPLEKGVRAVAKRWTRGRLQAIVDVVPSMLHMSANRLLGPDHDAEALALGLWTRALAARRARRGRR